MFFWKINLSKPGKVNEILPTLQNKIKIYFHNLTHYYLDLLFL